MQRRSILNSNLGSLGAPERLQRARKMPESTLRRRRADVITSEKPRRHRRLGPDADRSRSRHQSDEIFDPVVALEILIIADRALRLRCLGPLRLAPLQDREERRRIEATVLIGVPGAEERNGDGSGAAEGGLAVDEIGNAEGGGRGRGGGLGGGGDAGARAGVVAVGAEATEAVAEAGGADAAAPPLRGVLRALPHLLFLDVKHH